MDQNQYRAIESDRILGGGVVSRATRHRDAVKIFPRDAGTVRVVGMAHGVLFILYIWASLQAALEHNWSWKRTLLVLIASLLPAGPFVVEAKLLRQKPSPDVS
jgi:integral membrane protein